MTSDPPDLGKGLFGYRKSAVNQILADRDVMLRQAEGRVRAAESKVADLQNELASMKDRTTRMDEQVERLRSQLELLMANTQLPPTPAASAPFSAPTDLAAPLEAAATPEPETAAPWDSEPNAWEEDFGHPLEASPAPFEQSSSAGSGSEIIVPCTTIVSSSTVSVAPCVLPEIRLIAPGVEGPKLVPKELSLSAKCCA